MKKVILIFLISCHVLPSNAGGFTVKNGGGLSEFNLEYAVHYSKDLLQVCVTTQICGLSTQEMVIAKTILAAPPLNLVFVSRVEFNKNKSNELDPILRRSSPTTVQVNQEMLYPNEEPISLQQAVVYILRFTAQPYATTTSVSLFSEKVTQSSQFQSEQWSLRNFGYLNLGLALIHFNNDTQLYFHGGGSPYQLSDDLSRALSCPIETTGSRVVEFNDFHWLDLNKITINEFTLPLTAQIRYECMSKRQTLTFLAELEGELWLKLPSGSVIDFQNGKQFLNLNLQKTEFHLYMTHQIDR